MLEPTNEGQSFRYRCQNLFPPNSNFISCYLRKLYVCDFPELCLYCFLSFSRICYKSSIINNKTVHYHNLNRNSYILVIFLLYLEFSLAHEYIRYVKCIISITVMAISILLFEHNFIRPGGYS